MNKNLKFTEDLSFSIQEHSIDEAKRTVRVCALASCVSKNGRYYSPALVESVAGTLVGKKSYADHDERNTKNVIGKIVGEEYKNGKLYADIKISKAGGTAKNTWEKLSDGTLDSVSIAANGSARPMKMGDKVVSEVTELRVQSVDVVPDGGVAEAKVVRVFENIEDIPKLSEVKTKMKNIEELRAEYPDLVKEIDTAHEAKLKKVSDELAETKAKMAEKEVAAHKETRISELSVEDKVKDMLRKKVSGKTVEEMDESLKKEIEYLQEVGEALNKPVEIKGIKSAEKIAEEEKKKNKDKKTDWTSQLVRETEAIPEDLKGEAIKVLWNDGSKEMVKFLKGFKIEV